MISILRERRKKETGRGFTLIELLVVISIIAVLVAVIAISASGAIGAANTAKCAGNLRAIGAAFQEYLGDNNNFMPQRAYHGTITVGYSNLLLPYLNNNGQIFVCPSAPNGWPSEPSYGMNWYYDNANISSIQGMNQTSGVAPGSMQTLSTTIMATDTAGPFGTGSNRADQNSGDPGELAPTRHGGQANYLFFDGHVEKLPFSATQAPANLWGTDQENHTQLLPGM
jgi:prepilin-type processing-associated H-X9-DG protein/prepilin-type N-terminal cleavage/methylation domain-containing protein